MKFKKIVLAGGTGFLGQAIIDKYSTDGVSIVVLTRGTSIKKGNVAYEHWDGKTIGPWVPSLEDADLLINLTGKSVNCRYTEENKKEIIRSRVDSTHVLGQAIKSLNTPPRVWMNSASATIYRYSEDKDMDEFSGEYGEGFSVDVCKKWEEAFHQESVAGVRKVVLRISMVFANEGGVIPVMAGLTKKGLGGKMGSGKQYISWIHIHDFLRSIDWLMDHPELDGPFNMAAPQPITNANFMKSMRKVLHRSFGLPAYEWMLEIGAVFMKTETELILKSRKVVPVKLLQSGFSFDFPDAPGALENLLKK
jgi:hypothetical protein